MHDVAGDFDDPTADVAVGELLHRIWYIRWFTFSYMMLSVIYLLVHSTVGDLPCRTWCCRWSQYLNCPTAWSLWDEAGCTPGYNKDTSEQSYKLEKQWQRARTLVDCTVPLRIVCGSPKDQFLTLNFPYMQSMYYSWFKKSFQIATQHKNLSIQISMFGVQYCKDHM